MKLMDDPAVTAKKFRSAVTDTGARCATTRPRSPASRTCSTSSPRPRAESIAELEAEYDGRGYGDFKKDVAEAVVERLTPIRARTLELLEDPAELDRLLAIGAEQGRRARRADARATVYDRVGFVRRG